jgi:hypothetical protein
MACCLHCCFAALREGGKVNGGAALALFEFVYCRLLAGALVRVTGVLCAAMRSVGRLDYIPVQRFARDKILVFLPPLLQGFSPNCRHTSEPTASAVVLWMVNQLYIGHVRWPLSTPTGHSIAFGLSHHVTSIRVSPRPSAVSTSLVGLGEIVMILEPHRRGASVSAIGSQVGVGRETVRRCIERGLERRPVDRARRGRASWRRSRVTCANGWPRQLFRRDSMNCAGVVGADVNP